MDDRWDAIVAWDDEDDPQGNVRHIAEHGLTPEEVESGAKRIRSQVAVGPSMA